MDTLSMRSIGAFGIAAGMLLASACKTPDPASMVKDDETSTPAAGDMAGVYPGPSGALDDAENFALWSKYCSGTQNVADPVNPNYSNQDVMKAAKILSIVNKESFYLYRDILKFHQTALPAEASAAGIKIEAHNFLTYLCGEFRDRATMVKTKLEWAHSISYLAEGGGSGNVSCRQRNNPLGAGNEATEEWKPYESPWQQMCAEDYDSYLRLSREYFDTKQRLIESASLELEDGTTASGKLKINSISTIDRFVPGTTICETKYMFAEYIKKGRHFRDGSDSAETALTKWRAGYNQFKSGCSETDLNYYYDFRGDSNYKPNSPEGNGMIWFAKSVGLQCASRTKAKPNMTFKDEDCQRYFQYPFRSRFSAARAGLATWLLQKDEHESAMAGNGSTYFTVVQNNVSDPSYKFGDRGPFVFRINDQFSGKTIATMGSEGTVYDGFKEAWLKKDMGLSTLSGKTGDELKELIYRRIRNAVDRHTNWYRSGYDSDPKLPNSTRARLQMDQAYSPFVASSYEMSESDNFTACGPTIPCGTRPPEFTQHKHWMFVFKVRKDMLYRPEDIADGKLDIDFDNMWFDETAFGDSHLANAEKAWDRLGSPIEDEHAEIIYLYRLPN